MKLKVIGNTNRPVDLKYSLDGTTFIDTTLADLQQGIPLPEDQDYSQVKVKMNSTVMGALDIIKNIGIEAKTFKVAAGVYSQDNYPRFAVMSNFDYYMWNGDYPKFEYENILDNYCFRPEYSNWKSGEGGLYIFLRDSDFFTRHNNDQEYYYNYYKICDGQLERNNGKVEFFHATNTNMDIVFHNIETNEFTSYIRMENISDFNEIHNKYDVYLATHERTCDWKEIDINDEIPEGWESYNTYTVYLDEDGNPLGRYADPSSASSSIEVRLIRTENEDDDFYSPICKVGNLDTTQDYEIYRNAETFDNFAEIVDPNYNN